MKQITSVITTINYPTDAIEEMAILTNLIVVSDKRTPKDWYYDGVQFINTDKLPHNHYARKNLGYLAAIANGSQTIYDTDDDNIPNENWKERTVEVEALESSGSGWYNIFDIISENYNNYIWPRGFSLTQLRHHTFHGVIKPFTSSIQQGLSNGEPDVDAIGRLTNKNNLKNYFYRQLSVYLNPGAWCPFNSQSTWWFPKAYPLMYLPITASFRMTDIWRSFIAQRCLWEMGEGVTFHSPAEVYQDRNEHDLLKDFEDEIPGYLNNDRIVKVLQDLPLNGDVFSNMLECYKALIDIEIFPAKEMPSVRAWIKDIQKVWKP